uniref:hypothetical protein n=1 Tax=Thaumasiovibrio occultus TaxID=1891184 RepID=UPI000B35F962|nr:hypothetical protein [Thaumasiovibrio occultus]
MKTLIITLLVLLFTGTPLQALAKYNNEYLTLGSDFEGHIGFEGGSVAPGFGWYFGFGGYVGNDTAKGEHIDDAVWHPDQEKTFINSGETAVFNLYAGPNYTIDHGQHVKSTFGVAGDIAFIESWTNYSLKHPDIEDPFRVHENDYSAEFGAQISYNLIIKNLVVGVSYRTVSEHVGVSLGFRY